MYKTPFGGPLANAGSSLQERVIAVVAETLGREPESIQTGQHLMAHLGASSLDLVDLGFRLEQAFGVELDTNRLIDPAGQPGQLGSNDLTVAGVVELVREAQASP
jgi:acyl carrier protein